MGQQAAFFKLFFSRYTNIIFLNTPDTLKNPSITAWVRESMELYGMIMKKIKRGKLSLKIQFFK